MTFNTKFEQKNDENTSLKDVRIMNEEGMKWGLPGNIWLGGLCLIAFFVFRGPWYMALPIGGLYFCVAYAIHAHDPKAYLAWAKTFRAKTHWTSAKARVRRYVHLEE